MPEFRVNLTVEVDRVANALAIQTPVPLQIACERGRWSAACADPALTTPACDSFEQALTAGARQIAAELQASVFDRPVILARITPEDIPPGRF